MQRKAAGPPQSPFPLMGAAAIKGSGRMGLTTTWTDKYLKVEPPGVLHFYDNKQASMSGATSNPAPIELRDIGDFTIVGEGQLKITMAYEKISHVLKFVNNPDMVDWKKGLILWKDYLEHGEAYYKAQLGGIGSTPADVNPASSGMSGHSLGAMDIDFDGLEAGTDDIPISAGTIGDEKPAARMGYLEMNASSLYVLIR